MYSRNVSYSLTVDGEMEHVTAEAKPACTIPDKEQFKTATITTCCRTCSAKHELTYSASFPGLIEFYCPNCEKQTLISNTHGPQSAHSVLSKLHEEAKKRESYAIGYNYSGYHSSLRHEVTQFMREQRMYTSIGSSLCFIMGILLMGVFTLLSSFILAYVPGIFALIGFVTLGVGWVISAKIIETTDTTVPDHITDWLKQQYAPRDTYLDPEDIHMESIRLGAKSRENESHRPVTEECDEDPQLALQTD